MILLVESKIVAKLVAEMLYKRWDGCNGILLEAPVDIAALFCALELVAGTRLFSFQGECCSLNWTGGFFDSSHLLLTDSQYLISRLPVLEGRKANTSNRN